MKFNKEVYKQTQKKIFQILLVFSFILISTYLILDTYFYSNTFKNISLSNAIKSVEERERIFKRFLEKSTIELNTINNNKIFKDYKKDKNNSTTLKNLFLFVANNNSNIMQLRYIDKNGKEKIRVNREFYLDKPILIDENKLQDKSNRDYFLKSKKKKLNQVWFSKLDLNIENNKIQIPYNSTIRAILSVDKNNTFDGIIVINYFMNSFLDSFMKNNLYENILIDNDGFVIHHYEKDKSWGRYKNDQVKISDINKNFKDEIFLQEIVRKNNFVSKQLDLQLENKLILILKLNSTYELKEKRERFLSELLISLTIFLFSIILIFLVSRILEKNLLILTNYEEYVTLIDENIITSTTDLKGVIVYASKAFCKISGYDERELIGRKHNIVKHPDEDVNKYKSMWQVLLSNNIWEGEFKNRRKNGETYWVKAKIYAIYDNNKKKIGYTAIRQDITDKKIIEDISIHDGLTNLYNRKYFDTFMPKVLNSTKRNNALISFAMIDVDYFKKYNDTYGHHKGDTVLKSISTILNNSLKRSIDYAFRIGGEEFALFFVTNDLKESITFCEKLRTDIENLKIEHKGSDTSKYVTVSIGLICKKSREIENYEDLYKMADELLYQAKNRKRNIVVHNLIE